MGWLIHDPLTRFIAQVTAVVLVSRILGMITRRLGQPMVIAEITAGILLGPSLLGWLLPEASAQLFAPESLGLLQIVSQLGLILFMFLIGLELDPALLRGRGRSSVAISHTSIVVPFVLGGLLAIYLHPRVGEEGVSFTPFALFIGAAMSITAFPVLARILAERRLLRTHIGAIVIACAAVDDVTAWCLLAFVVATARASGLGGAITTTALALGYITVMFFVVRPLLGRLGARIATREGLTQNVVAATLLLLFASSWATELIGIHALFGAFLFGAILPKEGGYARALAEKLEDIVVVLILPLFFAYSGVRTQIALLDSPWAWAVCGLVILVACLGKFGGSFVAARLTGLPWRESAAVGVLMNTRGLMELIVLNIGLDLGVISPTLFAMLVVMALVTTFMTTPILHRIYPPDLIARDLAEPERAPVELPGEPAPVPAHFSALVCVAFEQSGPGLVTLAGMLSDPRAERTIYALHLLRPPERASFFAGPERTATSDSALGPLLQRARELDLTVRPLSFVSGDPASDISRVAQVKGVDLILIGWHKPVFSQTFLGGTVYRVMKEAKVDVGVFIDRGLRDVRRVLVPFQGSAHDRAALALAQRIMQTRGAEVTILHVHKPERPPGETPLGARRATEEAFGEAGGGQVLLKTVEHDSPADVALAESAGGYDLVIVGAGAEWGLEQRLIGRNPERLMFESPTSLLVVRHGEAVLSTPARPARVA